MAAPLALPPPPAPARPRVLLGATALAVASAAMLLFGLIATYLQLRAEAGGTTADWVPEGASLPLVPGNMALITLVMSSITIQWAVQAVNRDDRRHTYLALAITIVFGIAFLNSMAFLFANLGVGVGDSAYGVVTYSLLGTMTAIAIAVVVFAALMWFRALGGQFTPRHHEGIVAAAIAWHFMVVAFFFVNAIVIWFK
jgi:cytochrome c oxidase subunit 3